MKASPVFGGRLSLALMAVMMAVTFFVCNDALPTDITEARNLVTAREMADDGHWLIPTMNGEQRLVSSPLPTWVAAVIESVSPGNLPAQRAASGAMGCMLTVYLFLMARYLSRRRDFATCTVMVFLTCYNLVLLARSATWDIYCYAFMMAGIYYFTRGLYEDRRHSWFPLAGLFFGLSFLSKGIAAFYGLLLPFLLTLVMLPTPGMRGKWKWMGLMLAIMVATGGWWYAYLLWFRPDWAGSGWGKILRAWVGYSERPWWYYWRFFLEMGAWSLLMLASLAVYYWKNHLSLQREYLLSVWWAILSLVVLSCLPEKNMRFLLPSLLPCSMTVATIVCQFHDNLHGDRATTWLFRANTVAVALAILAAAVLFVTEGTRLHLLSVAAAVVAATIMTFAAVGTAWAGWREHPYTQVTLVAVVFVVAELFLLPSIGGAIGNPRQHSIALLKGDGRLKGLPMRHNRNEGVRPEVVYYAGQKILPLDLADTAAVLRQTPFVLVSRRPAAQELPQALLQQVDTVGLGTFDDNQHPRRDRHYSQALISHVTIVKRK